MDRIPKEVRKQRKALVEAKIAKSTPKTKAKYAEMDASPPKKRGRPSKVTEVEDSDMEPAARNRKRAKSNGKSEEDAKSEAKSDAKSEEPDAQDGDEAHSVEAMIPYLSISNWEDLVDHIDRITIPYVNARNGVS